MVSYSDDFAKYDMKMHSRDIYREFQRIVDDWRVVDQPFLLEKIGFHLIYPPNSMIAGIY